VEISIKVASREYEQLRTHVPDGSSAREAVERATRIDYSLGGVLFEGYTIVCDEHAARGLQKPQHIIARRLYRRFKQQSVSQGPAKFKVFARL
jgi:hypothetical protein